MATEKFRTIGAVFDYTFKYKDTWQPSHKQYKTCRHHAEVHEYSWTWLQDQGH